MDRYRCLEILGWYGVGVWSHRILCNYWDRMTMVDRAGGYYREAFKSFKEVTQWGSLSPTIFNVIMDAVVFHWVLLMAGG